MNVGKTIPIRDIRLMFGSQHTKRTDRNNIEMEYSKVQQRMNIDFCQTGGLGAEWLMNFRRMYYEVFGQC